MPQVMPSILIVDDDPLVVSFLTDAVTREGYPCISTTRADEALLILRDQSIDVALLDVNMPIHSGIDIIRTARSAGATTRFLLITGGIDDDQRDEIESLGGIAYLHKPLRRHDILYALALLEEPGL